MSVLKISFHPVDTLFFRDGSPFNREELQANIRPIFPPSPLTLVGAIRAAWARQLDWAGGYQRWSDSTEAILGTGMALPKSLSFDGPYLFKSGTPVFPAPAHLLGVLPEDINDKQKPQHMVLLQPGASMHTDMGLIACPQVPAHQPNGELKPLINEWWISACGLKQILSGSIPEPETLLHNSKLWQFEHRMGNYRDTHSRTTQLNALYAPQHIRLHEDVALAMYAQGLPHAQIEAVQAQLAPVGGESRFCSLTIEAGSISAAMRTDTPKNSPYFTLVALTPIQLTQAPNPGLTIENAVLVSSCNPRPIMLGGWDNERPKQLVPHLPPGSVLFMQSSDANDPQQSHQIKRIAHMQNFGFGRCLTGVWPGPKENT